MRKVKIRYYDKDAGWVEIQGFFHAWGCSYEEFQAGPGNFSVALVEDEAGKIHEIVPSYVTFLEPYKPQQ